MPRPTTVRPVLVAVAVLIATGSLGQGLDGLKNTTPQERATAQTAMMKTKLGLTEEQTPKVAAINLKYAEKMEPIIKGTKGPLMKMRDAQGIQQEKEAELKQLLTPE